MSVDVLRLIEQVLSEHYGVYICFYTTQAVLKSR